MNNPRCIVLVAGLALLAGCGSGPKPRPTNAPTSSAPTPSETPTAEPTPVPSGSWKSRIKQGDDTFWMTIGGLPGKAVGTTKPERTSRMTFRLECDRGQVAATVRFDGAPRVFAHSCAEGLLTADLGTVRKGTEMEMSMEGTAGTSYVADIRY